jgi:hypothetical protein
MTYDLYIMTYTQLVDELSEQVVVVSCGHFKIVRFQNILVLE